MRELRARNTPERGSGRAGADCRRKARRTHSRRRERADRPRTPRAIGGVNGRLDEIRAEHEVRTVRRLTKRADRRRCPRRDACSRSRSEAVGLTLATMSARGTRTFCVEGRFLVRMGKSGHFDTADRDLAPRQRAVAETATAAVDHDRCHEASSRSQRTRAPRQAARSRKERRQHEGTLRTTKAIRGSRVNGTGVVAPSVGDRANPRSRLDAPGRIRTSDQRLRRPSLCPLSYGRLPAA